MEISKKPCSFFILALAVFTAIFLPMQAQSKSMEQIVEDNLSNIEEMAQSPVVVKAVLEQNAMNMRLEDIQRIDKEWIAGGQLELAESLQKNNVAIYLKVKMQKNRFLYLEAFLCDKNGAVVAEYPKTSDYWQGDEEKFTNCFNNGYGKVFIGETEFDESTQTNQVQVSVPVKDAGRTVGVLVVGLKSF
jgi:hypothetical protein